jgi:hypothetical protein
METMRVCLKLAAHSNEFSTFNKDGFSFMNVRAALSCIGKLVIFTQNLLKMWGAKKIATHTSEILNCGSHKIIQLR